MFQSRDLGEINRQPDATFIDAIHPMLKLAAWEAGANGYGLYEFDQARSELTLTCGYGTPSPASRSGNHFAAVVSFPLRGAVGLAGILDFGFHTAQAREEARLDILRLCAASMQSILEFDQRSEACLQVNARTAELDLLQQGPASGEATRAFAARALAGLTRRASAGGESEIRAFGLSA